MDWTQSLILGIVQGLTEFIPISSTAHLRIVPNLLGWKDPGAAFSAVIQLGTLLSMIVYFWKDIWILIHGAWMGLIRHDPKYNQELRLSWAIILGTLPIVVLGLTFKDFIETDARSLTLIGISLIVLAIFLFLAEKFSIPKRDISSLSIKDIQIIGWCQALALIPGCSRSGSTIMGGLWLGMKRESAARFSFLLGLPAIGGSGLLEFLELWKNGLGNGGWTNLIIGIFAAFVSGYLSIEFLLRFLKNYGTSIFVIYRIILGVFILLALI